MPLNIFRKNNTPSSGLTPAQLWMLGAGANLTVINSAPFDQLYYGGSNDDMRTLLVNWWGVHDRAGMIDKIQWLLNEGHRMVFRQNFADIAPLSEAGFAAAMNQVPEADRPTLHFIWQNRANFRQGDILAWDMGRLINMCRFGYTAGYMTEPEAWNTMHVGARQMQQAYANWGELAENYALGWRYWRNGQALEPKHIQAINWLRTDPTSPFLRVAWHTPLN